MNYSSTAFTNSYSMRERLLSSLTVKSAGSVTSMRPHLSTASLIDPLNMSIFALRMITVFPAFINSTAKKENQTSSAHKFVPYTDFSTNLHVNITNQ
ncbi:Nucleic acid-binding, OB-fold protein [Trifolium repens]|nr:Nucleic acid-binding, OB-fold protein [Trifolium repens]